MPKFRFTRFLVSWFFLVLFKIITWRHGQTTDCKRKGSNCRDLGEGKTPAPAVLALPLFFKNYIWCVPQWVPLEKEYGRINKQGKHWASCQEERSGGKVNTVPLGRSQKSTAVEVSLSPCDWEYREQLPTHPPSNVPLSEVNIKCAEHFFLL